MEIALKLRIPSWALSSGMQVEVNGQPWADCAPAAGPQAGSFCTVRRQFAPGGTSQPTPCAGYHKPFLDIVFDKEVLRLPRHLAKVTEHIAPMQGMW